MSHVAVVFVILVADAGPTLNVTNSHNFDGWQAHLFLSSLVALCFPVTKYTNLHFACRVGIPLLVEPPIPKEFTKEDLLHLTCFVRAKPAASVSWYRDSARLTEGDRTSFRYWTFVCESDDRSVKQRHTQMSLIQLPSAESEIAPKILYETCVVQQKWESGTVHKCSEQTGWRQLLVSSKQHAGICGKQSCVRQSFRSVFMKHWIRSAAIPFSELERQKLFNQFLSTLCAYQHLNSRFPSLLSIFQFHPSFCRQFRVLPQLLLGLVCCSDVKRSETLILPLSGTEVCDSWHSLTVSCKRKKPKIFTPGQNASSPWRGGFSSRAVQSEWSDVDVVLVIVVCHRQPTITALRCLAGWEPPFRPTTLLACVTLWNPVFDLRTWIRELCCCFRQWTCYSWRKIQPNGPGFDDFTCDVARRGWIHVQSQQLCGGEVQFWET